MIIGPEPIISILLMSVRFGKKNTPYRYVD